MLRTIAAALTAVILGIVANLVSNYFAPAADKRRRLTISLLVGLTVLTIILMLVSDEQMSAAQELILAYITALLAAEYGWVVVLLSVTCIIATLVILGRKAFRLTLSADLDPQETSYLRGMIADIARLNGINNWKDDYFVETEAEILDDSQLERVRPSFYLVQRINPGVSGSDFESLPNAEKAENSRGVSYGSFYHAVRRATDNAIVVLATPGGGKTVTLRRLARDHTEKRLKNGVLTPIFVNLAHYTGWRTEQQIESFESFLDSYFATGYKSWLNRDTWRRLLREGRCMFLLDGLDEIPRAANEHQARLDAVAQFVRAWPNTRFYLSCRELDYNYRLNFQQILIKPFDLRRVRRFIKLYFDDRPELFLVGMNVWRNNSLFQLAKVPFYLNLICGYIRRTRTIPSNRSELFSFVVDRVIVRELERHEEQEREELEKDVFRVHCRLAATMSIDRMVNVLSLESYLGSLAPAEKAKDLRVLNLGIRGGLLEADHAARTIRFAHHRFQEFFCAIYLVEQRRFLTVDLPEDFFYGIWWRETVLMIASIDPDPTEFVEMMRVNGQLYESSSALVDAAIKLDVLVTAHECLLSNDATSGGDLISQTRSILISQFSDETPLGKVKILSALAEDSSSDALVLLERAEKDESAWVSERAFLIRSGGSLRFRPTVRSASREFGRFLLAGRIFANAPSVFALGARFPSLRWLVALYVVFMLISFGAIAVVVAVAGVVAKFLVFDLRYSFDARCLQCLIDIGIMAAIISYLLTRNRPWLQRFLIAAPIALMCWFLVFNVPSDWLFKGAGIALALGLIAVLNRWTRNARRGDMSPWAGELMVFAGVAGLFLAAVAKKLISGDLNVAPGPTFGSLSVPVLVVILVIVVTICSVVVLRDLLVMRSVEKRRREARALIEAGLASPELPAALTAVFNKLGAHMWAQRALLDDVIVQLSNDPDLSDVARLEFLLKLGDSMPSSGFRDVLYRRCDELEANLRRAMARPADNDLAGE